MCNELRIFSRDYAPHGLPIALMSLSVAAYGDTVGALPIYLGRAFARRRLVWRDSLKQVPLLTNEIGGPHCHGDFIGGLFLKLICKDRLI